ncbi:MAG: DEAD/DEAH box helicase [Thermoplasmatota archaeon]
MAKARKFSDFALSDDVLDALDAMGFEEPTDIQAGAIEPALKGRDVIGQAQTGTGKTAAFAIPLVERIDPREAKTRALILVPTRELAEQVAGEVNEIGQFKGVHAAPVYGGAAFGPQIKEFRAGVPVVVGTPGRVMDHMRRGNLRLDNVQFLVLDEADRMLDMGFVEDIEWVLKQIPRDAQHLLFSATMPGAILRLAQGIMRDPLNVAVSEDNLTLEGTEQVYYTVGYRNKVWALYRVLQHEKPRLAFVFCRTKMESDKVARLLAGHGFPAEALHGDMTQAARNRVLENAREGKTRIVVATDVLARGIDISHCSHVINYDLPEDPEWYVHRIGRTGRMGRLGKAITFVTREEERALLDILDVSGGRLQLEEVPETGGRDRIRKVMDWKELGDRTGMVRFRMTGGKADGWRMMDIFREINRRCGFQENTLGRVHVSDDHTDVDVPFQLAATFWSTLRGSKFMDRKVDVHVVGPEGEIVEH